MRSNPEDAFHRRLLWGVAGLMLTALWIRPLPSSLWIDETGTWWVVKDGVRDAIHRSLDVQGESPLYYLMAWITREIAGPHEWALRLPSLVLMIGSAALLFRFARRIVDDEYARIALVGFIVWPAVSFAAADYRPYALATFGLICSTMLLVRWLARDTLASGSAYVLTLIALIYVHYLFGLIVPVHLCYVFARTREGSTTVSLRRFLVAVSFVALAVTPLMAQIAALWGLRNTWSVQNPVTVPWLVTLVVPTAFVVAGVVALTLALTSSQGRVHLIQPAGADLILLIAWLVIPLACLAVADRLEERYSLVAAPAAILLASLGIRWIEPATTRGAIVLVLAIVSALSLGGAHHGDDWRGALRSVAVRDDNRSAVILQTGFQQAGQLDSFTHPDLRAFLGSPTSIYDVHGTLYLLPNDGTPDGSAFARQVVAQASQGADRIYLVTGSTISPLWMDALLGPSGWRSERLPSQGEPFVYEYTRSPISAG
jgi:uncharacterized membrane protein